MAKIRDRDALTDAETVTLDVAHTSDDMCPLRDVLNRIGDKWSVLVVVELKAGKLRLSSLRRAIEGISQRMLAQTLRQLERDGMVARTVFPSVPVRVEYELTPLGLSLNEPLAAIACWAESHLSVIQNARDAYDRSHRDVDVVAVDTSSRRPKA